MKKVIFIVIVVVLNSCYSVNKIERSMSEGFTLCFTNELTEIRSLINVDGYYSFMKYAVEEDLSTNRIYVDSTNFSYLSVLFYEDGTFLYNFFPPHDFHGSIPEYLEGRISSR